MAILGLEVEVGKRMKGKVRKMCVFTCSINGGKKNGREGGERDGGKKRETTQRERDTSGGTTWDTHTLGKNTLTLPKMLQIHPRQ